MYTDTHAHIDFDQYDADRDEVMRRAREAGVTTMITIGTCVDSSTRAVALTRQYPNTFAAVGIHPHDAGTYTNDMLAVCETLAHDDKVVAIGEVGLDYFRDLAPRDKQQAMFRDFLELHKRTGKPLIIHARDSYDDILAIMKKEVSLPIKGVMHCFSGDEAVLEQVLALGLYISFAGQLTFKKNDALRAVMKCVPDNRLLVETDCPFLTPQSKRGQRNEPSYLIETAQCMAQVRGVKIEDIARMTTVNAATLFGLPDGDTAKFAYKIRDTVYLNVTSACSCACVFCPRTRGEDKAVKGYDLAIDHDPSVDEMLSAVAGYSGDFTEICFCGFGEPLMRFDFVKAVATRLKQLHPTVPLRIDTNGQGNLINKRNVVPELKGLIDAMSISLNAQDSATYHRLVQPGFSGDVYAAVKEFISEAKKYVPSVTTTCLNYPGVDTEAVRRIAENELGVTFRLRIYNEVG